MGDDEFLYEFFRNLNRRRRHGMGLWAACVVAAVLLLIATILLVVFLL
jgi:hypothetical protein